MFESATFTIHVKIWRIPPANCEPQRFQQTFEVKWLQDRKSLSVCAITSVHSEERFLGSCTDAVSKAYLDYSEEKEGMKMLLLQSSASVLSKARS